MRISFESPNQLDAIALIAELDAYQSTLYPPESHHALDLASVAAERVLFALARDEAGQAVGCGAIVLSPEYGEIACMCVQPSVGLALQGGCWRRSKRQRHRPAAACSNLKAARASLKRSRCTRVAVFKPAGRLATTPMIR